MTLNSRLLLLLLRFCGLFISTRAPRRTA